MGQIHLQSTGQSAEHQAEHPGMVTATRGPGERDAGACLAAAREADARWRAGERRRLRRRIRLVRAGGWLLDRSLGAACAGGALLLVLVIVAAFRPLILDSEAARSLLRECWLQWVAGLYLVAALREAVEPIADGVETRCRRLAQSMGLDLDPPAPTADALSSSRLE